MTIPFGRLRGKWMKDPVFRKAHKALAPEFELAQTLIKARLRAGLTQAQVARRMGTRQSVVARLEGGLQHPTTKTLERYAKATRSRVKISLVATES
jgi:predicted transcriptional regulator